MAFRIISNDTRTQEDMRRAKKTDKLPRMLLSSYAFLEKLLIPHNVSSPKRAHFPKFGKRSVTEANSVGAGPSDNLETKTPQRKRFGWNCKLALYEIRHWHSCTYGEKQGEANLLSPPKLGHAAAYEAFRTWIHSQTGLQTLENKSGNMEHVQKVLTDLSTREVLRLLQTSKYPIDNQTTREATDAAVYAVAFLITIPRGKKQYFRTQSTSRETEAFNDLDVLYAADDAILYKPLSQSSASSDHGKLSARSSLPSIQESELILDISAANSDTPPPTTTPKATLLPHFIVTPTSPLRPGHNSEPIPAYREFLLESARIAGRRLIKSAPTVLSIVGLITSSSEYESDSEERISYATSRTVSTDYGNGMFYIRRAISTTWSKHSSRSPRCTYRGSAMERINYD